MPGSIFGMMIQVTGVQHPAGRRTPYVRAFGYRSLDPDHKVVEVALSVDDALALIGEAAAAKQFPEIEVDEKAWVYCLNSGDVKVVHMEEPA